MQLSGHIKQVAVDYRAAVPRLAWHLFTEHEDMDDPDTMNLAFDMWDNPRHADTVASHMERARRYLEIALGVKIPASLFDEPSG